MARTRRPGPGTRRVEERLVEGARPFFTIGPEAFVWKVLEAEHLGTAIGALVQLRGAFVRLEPPPESTDEEVARVRRLCEEHGAVRVQVLPRRRAAEVLDAPRERRPHPRVRDVVRAMVEEARAEDRDALRQFTDAVMARRGL